MNPSPNTWVGQVTTGHGVMILAPTLLAVLAGTMSWPTALPLLVASVVGLAWPENAPLLEAARTAATDAEAMIESYRGRPARGAVPPVPGPGPSGLAALAVAGLTLAACAGLTPAQQAAALQAAENGIVCLADTTIKVAEAGAAPALDAIKAAHAAAAFGGELATDPACRPPFVPPPVQP